MTCEAFKPFPIYIFFHAKSEQPGPRTAKIWKFPMSFLDFLKPDQIKLIIVDFKNCNISDTWYQLTSWYTHLRPRREQARQKEYVIKADSEFLYFRIRYDVNCVECGRKPALKPSILQLRRMAHLSGSGLLGTFKPQLKTLCWRKRHGSF